MLRVASGVPMHDVTAHIGPDEDRPHYFRSRDLAIARGAIFTATYDTPLSSGWQASCDIAIPHDVSHLHQPWFSSNSNRSDHDFLQTLVQNLTASRTRGGPFMFSGLPTGLILRSKGNSQQVILFSSFSSASSRLCSFRSEHRTGPF